MPRTNSHSPATFKLATVRPSLTTLLWLLSATVLTTSGVGCDASQESSEPTSTRSKSTGPLPSEEECLEPRDYYERFVWPAVQDGKCLGCHLEGGVAADHGAEFLLSSDGDEISRTKNESIVLQFAEVEAQELPLLIAKPSAVVEHGGGKIIEQGGALDTHLARWLALRDEGRECESEGDGDPTVVPELRLEDERETLRRAALQVLGRLPTPEEEQALDSGASLYDVFRPMLDGPGLEAFLAELFNDDLHTRGPAFKTGGPHRYPAKGLVRRGVEYNYWDLGKWDLTAANSGIGQAASKLIWEVVSSDRPFTEVLTADYQMLTPKMAWLFNSDVEFDDPENDNEWRKGNIRVAEGVTYPNVGLLTSPSFLGAWPTNSSNLHRNRILTLFRAFLDIDILSLSDQPADPEQSEYEVPTEEDPNCAVCHKILDPAAAAYRSFQTGVYHQMNYSEGSIMWPEELDSTVALEEEVLPEGAEPLQWLAHQITQHPGFAQANVARVYENLVGRKRLSYPSSDADSFEGALAAWKFEQEFLDGEEEAFVEGGHLMKELIARMVVSPAYRVQELSGPNSDNSAWREAFASSRLMTPEHLSRKVNAVLGVPWTKMESLNLRLAFGGIDSFHALTRNQTPNSIAMSALERMTYEVGCIAIAADLQRAADERRLLGHWDLADPIVGAAEGSPEELRVDQALQSMLQAVRGDAEGEAVEIAELRQLLFAIHEAGKEAVQAGELSAALDPTCVPQAESEFADADYKARAWMGVLRFLLLNEEFFHQ